MGTVNLHQCMGHFMAMASLGPLLSELAGDEYVQEKVLETARQFFSNGDLTVSLWPSFVVGGLFLLLAFPLLGFLFGDSAGSTGSGYGAPEPSYGAPEPSYGAPEPSYGAPSSSYGFRRSDPGYDEAEYRTVYSDVMDSQSGSSSHYEVDQRFQDLAAPAIGRVVRAAQQLIG